MLLNGKLGRLLRRPILKQAMENTVVLKSICHALVIACVLFASRCPAQSVKTLYSFTALNNFGTNRDGVIPTSQLVYSAGRLYGTTDRGGVLGGGTAFGIDIDGTGFSVLHHFSLASCVNCPNSGGGRPQPLILSGNKLYGTTSEGGSGGSGTIFSINTDGTGFRTLLEYSAQSGAPQTNSDGAYPYGGLILSGVTLYGTTSAGGSLAHGTVFSINSDGTGFKTLHNLPYPDQSMAPLVLSGNTLFGTVTYGGSSGVGSILALHIEGTAFTNLHSFYNSDGKFPEAGLALSGDTLYGTAGGGSWDNGTVFKINTDGTSFTSLYNFTPTLNQTNGDGANPVGCLVVSGQTLYGTTQLGGTSGCGTVFSLNIDGTGFTNLYNFTSGTDGAGPRTGLVLCGNILYGTTTSGGVGGNGTLFAMALPASRPLLGIVPYGNNIILEWSTNANGFTLQSSTNLTAPSSWSAVSPGPIGVNGQNLVILTTPGAARRFFRLSQ